MGEVRGLWNFEHRTLNFLSRLSCVSRSRFTNDEDLARWAAGGSEAAI